MISSFAFLPCSTDTLWLHAVTLCNFSYTTLPLFEKKYGWGGGGIASIYFASKNSAIESLRIDEEWVIVSSCWQRFLKNKTLPLVDFGEIKVHPVWSESLIISMFLTMWSRGYFDCSNEFYSQKKCIQFIVKLNLATENSLLNDEEWSFEKNRH